MNSYIFYLFFRSINIKTISEFEKFFLSQDIDPNLIKRKISIEILWNQLIYSKFKQNVKIDRQSIKNELSNNVKKREFLQIGRASCRERV